MKQMYLVGAVVMFFVLLFVPSAMAKGGGITIDGSLTVADETYNGSDAALGFGLGISYDLMDMVRLKKGRLIGRADINFYQGSTNYLFFDLDSSRTPLFFGVRYVLPVDVDPVALFAEVGLEVSMDKYDQAIPVGGLWIKHSASDTNLGISPGFGVILPLENGLSIGANARLHSISDSYLSFSFTLGYSF